MLGGDGTGSLGQGRGRARKGNQFALGQGGRCICSSCGYTISHARGQPCNQLKCPHCGNLMMKA
jgi:hypothetical protein